MSDTLGDPGQSSAQELAAELRQRIDELVDGGGVSEREAVDEVIRYLEQQPGPAQAGNERAGELVRAYKSLRAKLGGSAMVEEALAGAMERSLLRLLDGQRSDMQGLVEAQTKYLSFLSHELRGGLNGILLMLEVLRRDLAGEARFAESMADLDVMRTSILETVSTMDRFVQAQRLRKGKIKVRPGEVRLAQLISGLVQQLAPQAKQKDLAIEADAPAEASVVSDREMLGLILQNLLGNAIKYSRRGAVRVVCVPGGDGWRIDVIDRGPGIAPEKLPTLFELYTRGDTHGQAGSGLGLSIARQAAELIGAKLSVESKLGEGSTFRVELPGRLPIQEPR